VLRISGFLPDKVPPGLLAVVPCPAMSTYPPKREGEMEGGRGTQRQRKRQRERARERDRERERERERRTHTPTHTHT